MYAGSWKSSTHCGAPAGRKYLNTLIGFFGGLALTFFYGMERHEDELTWALKPVLAITGECPQFLIGGWKAGFSLQLLEQVSYVIDYA